MRGFPVDFRVQCRSCHGDQHVQKQNCTVSTSKVNSMVPLSLMMWIKNSCKLSKPWGQTTNVSSMYRSHMMVSVPTCPVEQKTSPPPSSVMVKGRVQLYLYSSSGSSCPALGWTSHFVYGAWMWIKYQHVSSLKAELNPICHLQSLLGVHHILHVFRIRVKLRLFSKSQKNIMKYNEI